MGTFTKGEIVLFPFPYTDLSNRKLRPCLVISDQMSEDIMLCQITSKHIHNDKYSIEIKSNETLEGTLAIDSLIRTNMIFTATIKHIKMKMCKISDQKYKAVVDLINQIIRK